MPVFLHAAASFEPRERAVLLWTRLTGATATTWVVTRDPHLRDVVATGEAATGPELDHTVTVDVDGLEPGTSYWYRFEAGGERSPIGRTRTLPSTTEPTARFRLGMVSCARFSVAPLGVYRAMAEREVDLVLHLGDYIYEDDGHKGLRDHRPAHACVTVADYRQRFAQYREDPDCQALHLRHPMSLLVDDHDVADNCWTGGAKAHDSKTQGPWPQRAAAAMQARQEWVPSRLRSPDQQESTWRSFPIGDLAELVLLDTRLSGRDRHAGDEGALDRNDPARSLLGDEQRAWLTERVADVTRPWVLIGSGVVVNEVLLPLPAAAGLVEPLLPSGYAAVEGEILHDDQWDGYPLERQRLVRAMAARGATGARSLVLSGDIHSSWAFEGPRDEDGSAVAAEFTIPAVSSKPMGHSRMPGAWRLLDATVRRLEHVPWVDVSERGYGILDLTPDDATAEWWFVQPTAHQPGREAKLGAAFRTRRASWPPRLERVEEPAPDPIRPGLPAGLPGRPDDLPRMRRSHLVRVMFARVAGLLVPLGLGGALLHRRRR